MSGYFFSKDSLSKEDRVLLFVGNRILVRNGEFLWRRDQIAEEFIAQDTMIKVSDGREDFLVTRAPAGVESFLDAELSSLRSLLFEGDERAMLVVGKANQLLDWHASHQFCGFCGEKTVPDRSGQALFCDACQHAFFPSDQPLCHHASGRRAANSACEKCKVPYRVLQLPCGFHRSGGVC